MNIGKLLLMCHNEKMSIVVGLKCADGLVVGSDSLLTITNSLTKERKVKKVNKVFKGEDFVVAFFNTFTIFKGTEPFTTIDALSECFLKISSKKDIFIFNLLNQLVNQPSVYTYEFLIGFCDKNEFKLEHFIVNGAKVRKEKIDNFYVSNTEYSYSYGLVEKNITTEKGVEVVRKMIETTIYLQSNLLNYANVGGDVIVKVLK